MQRVVRPWAGWVLGAYAVAVAAVLLGPVSPGALVEGLTGWLRRDLGWTTVRQGWIEFGANVLLFVPLGFLITMLLRRLWVGFVAALVLSVCAELVQVVLPARTASVRDVVANVAGAVLGAVAAWLVLRLAGRRGPRAPQP